ncbi:MAG: hypothetical protein P8Z50_07490, partial [candidate division WOR-3 bacterium]
DTVGYHADLRGNPGEIMIGFLVAVSEKDTITRNYSIVAFNGEGKPLTIKEGEKVRIVVLEE